MNINHLNQITPEWVAEIKGYVHGLDTEDDVACNIAFYRAETMGNRHLIIAALEAALRLKHELSSTKGDEG